MSTDHRAPRARLLTLAALTLIAAMTAACSGVEPAPGSTSGSSPRPTSPFDPTTTPPPTGPLVAYRAADEIGLVDGTDVVASAPGTFDASNDLIVTEDGQFVFARNSDGQLVTLDVSSGEASTRDVTLDSALGTGENSTVVWWEKPNRLMQLDLADPDSQPVLTQTVDLPAVQGAQVGQARLLVARGGTAVLARVEGTPSPFGGPDTLYAVHGPEAPTSLGQVDANSPVTVARLGPDGARLAYATYQATRVAGQDAPDSSPQDACGTAAVVLTGADGSQQTYEVAGADAASGSRVPKLWWPAQGLPRLSLMTWRCDQPESYAPLVWQLSEDGMTQLEPPTSAIQIADISSGQRAMILAEDGDYGDASGALVLEDSGRRIPIRSDVDAIAVLRPAP